MFWRDDIDPGHEHHKVLIHKGAFVDSSRGERAVPYKVYYPVAHDLAHLPVVIWSHGLGGSRDGAAFLARYIAGNGYVVVNIQHAGTDTGIWEGKPGHPWDVIRKAHIPRQASLDRFYDVPFVIDNLPRLAAEKPEIGAHMDLERLGMSGHSFGAMTTQVAAGQLFPDAQEQLVSLKESRISAGILYSFTPMAHLTDAPGDVLYGPMDIPLLFMTGTDDESPVDTYDYTYRMPVYEHAGSAEKSLLVLQGGDHMVFAGSRGKLEAHPKRHLHEDIIKALSLAFWDCYLKEDASAADWLKTGGAKAWLGAEAEYDFSGS
ncbi:MAG: hypothetical protein H6867_04190 [Rhodospirillales bacterium]|nr:hypothetical protein [Rhodospirillales bacterium]MCB9996350.1 hypothetical protein [Rhodospirillales bacterium]